MRAAGAAAPAQSPLVAAYTPPSYQTTPPHVDINAVIEAMNSAKPPEVPGAGVPSPMMSPYSSEQQGGGDALSGDAAQNAAGAASDPNVGGTSVESVGYAQGGPVTAGALAGPDPAGPDAGYAALQPGEFVIKKDAAQAAGKKTLAKINDGDGGSEAIAKKVADRVSAKNDRVPDKAAKK